MVELIPEVPVLHQGSSNVTRRHRRQRLLWVSSCEMDWHEAPTVRSGIQGIWVGGQRNQPEASTCQQLAQAFPGQPLPGFYSCRWSLGDGHAKSTVTQGNIKIRRIHHFRTTGLARFASQRSQQRWWKWKVRNEDFQTQLWKWRLELLQSGAILQKGKLDGNIHIYVNMHMQAWICGYVCA